MTLDDLITAARHLKQEYGGDTAVVACVVGPEGFTTREVCVLAPPLVIQTPQGGEEWVIGIGVVSP